MPEKFFFSKNLEINQIDGFHLLQDHIGTPYANPWNDYDYIVTFQVHRVNGGKRHSFGKVKILARDYKNTSRYFEEKGRPVGSSIEVTDALKSGNVVSMANEIDYYRRLHKVLGSNALQYLRGICDASYFYTNYSSYKNWPGFSGSIFRDGAASRAILKAGAQVAMGRHVPEKKFELIINDLPETFESITFHFDNKRSLGRTNINLVIGKNGVGKSHILHHLIEIVVGLKENSESWPYFHKVIVAAYSPFETFDTKNRILEKLDAYYASGVSSLQDLEKSTERRQLQVNEYSYVGFKSFEGDFSLSWPKIHSARSLLKVIEYDIENFWWTDDSRFKTLFDTLRLSIDFDHIALTCKDGTTVEFGADDKKVREDGKKQDVEFDFEEGISFIKGGNLLQLSSGQNIYSYLLPCLVAEIEDESLLIIDEPELYLHPTMEVGLINMLKSLLAKTSSNAIIATHSSVMVREVEREGVTILRNPKGTTQSSHPGFETFGQSIDLIIGEAFDDYCTTKPYEQTIDEAIKKYGSAEDAMKEIGPKVGDEALAYIVSKFEDNSEIIFENPQE
ncbi:putative ATPase [Variovorax sp. W1I1]|uniref:ATP-dependent nuclease n=1 Tax=Variovorax sp. W1I1 TaxID=3042309 RepID=UPI002781CC87|nr:AAA family ATPase [Variovorax sp. W1I1]MDQ0607172.1 putative ATPase [Variovorax sp. W1I1]